MYFIDLIPNLKPPSPKGVYQYLDQDIVEILYSLNTKIRKYDLLKFYFRNIITVPPISLRQGFEKFCLTNHVKHSIADKPGVKIDVKKGEAYLLIDDEDLVQVIQQAQQKGLTPGIDIGIISYNDSSLKEVVGSGISVISTDFTLMGQTIAQMIKGDDKTHKRNPSHFIDRGSF